MPKAKKRGRPPLPKGHVKGKIVPVRLNDEELKLFTKAAAKSEHESLSSWIRHTLREAANGNNKTINN
jgi:predicted HicB family RNase H-like nuclease